jgi:uncharacterized protein YciI
MAIERPAVVTDNHLKYLDQLRESGVTNMYGAGPYLQRVYKLARDDAHKVLGYWMDSFTERHPK